MVILILVWYKNYFIIKLEHSCQNTINNPPFINETWTKTITGDQGKISKVTCTCEQDSQNQAQTTCSKDKF